MTPTTFQVALVVKKKISLPKKEKKDTGSIPDWFDLLSVQGTLKSLLQHHNSKASIVQRSVFFMAQLSHLHITTGKNIALTI